MISITIIMTTYNRKNKTLDCLSSLLDNKLNIKFIIVDDNSSDGTVEAIKEKSYNCEIISGNGNLFWNGGMRKGIEYVIENDVCSDYYLLVNDDVDFYPKAIEKIIRENNGESITVGATCDRQSNLTYGAIKLKHKNSVKYDIIEPNDKNIICDTFNANCVLIPSKIFNKIGNLDSYYIHSMGDFDYGFKIKNRGYKIYSSKEYVGICEKNKINGTWMDPNLGVIESIRLKESFKGLPFKQWFYYLNKNYGVIRACYYSVTPYLKIFVKVLRANI